MFKIEKKGAFGQNSIKDIASLFHEIDFHPPYQRYGNIWTLEKRQLLLDSILNGYDLPKFYLHYITELNSEINKSGMAYAIIDGKQRLQTIKDFINNEIRLNKNFVYEHDQDVDLADMSYNEMGSKYPEIKFDFDSFELDIIYVITDELERIEELFYRLNEGKPLNSAEKRNRIVGYINNTIKEIIENNDFFTDRFKYTNKRLQYEDTCLKLIVTEYEDALVSFTRNRLDRFVEENRNKTDDTSDAIVRLIKNLEKLNNIFINNDPLLKTRSVIPVYYYFITRLDTLVEDTRPFLKRFEEIRIDNREKKDSNPILNEFDRQSQQGTHREKSLVFRETVLEKYYIKYKSSGIDWDTKIPLDDLNIEIDIE